MPILGGGGTGTGTGTPPGGAANSVLKKNSIADGDTSWVIPAAVDHVIVPTSSIGSGTPGTGLNAAAVDHVHPVSSGGAAGGLDAHMAVIPITTTTGNIFPVVFGGVFDTTNAAAGTGHAVPCRVSASGTFLLGLEVTTAVAAAFVRLAIFADSTIGAPGTLVFDSGQLSAVTTGQKFAATSITLLTGARYWFSITQEAGASGIVYRSSAIKSQIPVGITSNNIYPGNSYRLGVGPYASTPTIIAIDADLPCPCFLLKVP